MSGKSTVIRGFAPAVQEQLGCYVYRLIDPRDGRTFYVGKGVGNRLFSHLGEADADLEVKTHKLDRIRAIKRKGLEVGHVIHRWGLTEKEAYEVEAALIDAYEELTNLQGGRHNDRRGAMRAEDVAALLDPEPADIVQPVVLINIRQEWDRALSPEALYERTRQYWYCSPRRHPARYALAVARGVIRAVYRIENWYPVDLTKTHWDSKRKGAKKPLPRQTSRWAFEGPEAVELRHYVGKSVRHLQNPGNQNPIRWVNC